MSEERNRQEAAIQQKLAAMFAANSDNVSIPKIYIDMTGDIEAAAVLDELMFWTLPKKATGKTSLRVFKKGALWLAVRRKDWWDRKRLTERQADSAISKLVKSSLVEKQIFLFDGKPTVHLRMNMETFGRMYGEKMSEIAAQEDDETLIRDIADLYEMMGFPNETVNSNLQNGEMLNLQNGEIINSPIQPPNTTNGGKPPISLTAEEIEQATRKADAILGLAIPADPSKAWRGRDMMQPELLHYADWYNATTGQIATKANRTSWWKALRAWEDAGLEIKHLQEAYNARSKWRTVADPNELTKDAAAIKALGERPVEKIYEEGKSSGYYG